MEPIFIYYNNLEFKEKKVFNVEFSNEDRIQGVIFRKDKDYYITSMSCFIELTTELSDVSQYKQIIEISNLSNEILKRGVDYKYKEKELEVTFGDGIRIDLNSTKENRSLSVETVEFFDHVTHQKRFVLIYSPYKELKTFGLKFEKQKSTGKIGGYTINMKEINNKQFLEKELFFNENIIENLFQNYEYKNVVFLKFRGRIYPMKLDIIKQYYNKIKNKNKDIFHLFIHKTLFPND